MYAATAIAIVLAVVLLLIRAVRGPTPFDRILAVNSMGTLTVLLIAVLGFFHERPEWLDLAIVYALLNFIGTIAVLRYTRYGNMSDVEEEHEGLFPWKPSK